MRLNPAAVLKEHASEDAPEAGVDPLPIPIGPLDPLYKVWSAVGAWPLGVALMSTSLGLGFGLSLVMPFEKLQKEIPQPFISAVPRLSLGKCTLTYHKDFDRKRCSLFVMNHTSILDAHVACWAVPHAFCGIQHAHHFKVPVYGWLMKRANGIGVTKGAPGQAEAIAAQVHDRARRGISILGFPEGRRTQNGRLLPYRKGLFIMARDGGIPVVPLCVRGLWAVLRRGEWVLRPAPLDVFVGPQVETAGLSDEQIEVMAERFQRFTADYVERGIVGDVKRLDPRNA